MRISAPAAGIVSMIRWTLGDLATVPKNGYSVFSAFSCGGGSSMGYKLAGYDVIGHCEIDPRSARMYQKNLRPQYAYVMDIREMNALPDMRLPPELFNLDILDGSPPCSVFSTAGNREADWGKCRRFREGQAPQTLDDLFFEFIKLAGRLRPRVVVAENVKGLLVGKARGYVHEIVNGFRDAGYDVQIFCLNAARMGVPQRRERVFFIGRRNDQCLPNLSLAFNEPLIPFGQVRTAHGRATTSHYAELMRHKRRTDKDVSDIIERVYGKKNSGFNNQIVWDDEVTPTITSNGQFYRACDNMLMSDGDMITCQTFPADYDFDGQSVQYVCGMSVPPLMMKSIATQIQRQWFDGAQ